MSRAVNNAESHQAANIWLNILKEIMKFEGKEYVKFIMLFNEYDIIWAHILAYHWMNVCLCVTSENTLDRISVVLRFLWFSLECEDKHFKE
jgi:hypothetical protein